MLYRQQEARALNFIGGLKVQPVAIITGASSGIGLETAKLLLKKKYAVISIARRTCKLDGVESICIDISNSRDLKAAMPRLKKLLSFKRSIAVIHAACLYKQDNLVNIESSDLISGFNTSITAALILNQALITQMDKGSAIIYIGSTLSEKAVANAMSYVVIKHALLGLMRATCQDLYAWANIHTCCICPGFTDTDMLRKHIPTELVSEIKKRVSAGRLIEPAEIADLIFYCIGQPILNGSLLHANLGQVEH